MATNGHRRQVLLFLIAIILPCVVLVVLGVRMVVQERELREKRLADERRSLTSQLRQELSARLDRIALEQATAPLDRPERPASRDYGNPAVVLVAMASRGSLILPWEDNPRAARFRQLLEQDAFARLVSQGERAEIGSGRSGEAVDFYASALAAARDPAQAAYARLLRARALLAAGRRGTALRDLESVLASSLDLVDEHGVPLALYAASRLLESAPQHEAVIDRVREVLDDPRWLTPTTLYLLRDLVESLGSSSASAGDNNVRALAAAIATRLTGAEQMIALQRDFQRLGLAAGGSRMHNAGTRWAVYGAPPWLVGRAEPLGGEGDVVVAVRADSLFAAAEDVVLGSSGTGGNCLQRCPCRREAGRAARSGSNR